MIHDVRKEHEARRLLLCTTQDKSRVESTHNSHTKRHSELPGDRQQSRQ